MPERESVSQVSRETLIGGSRRLAEEDVDVPGIGTVRVRGLTRQEHSRTIGMVKGDVTGAQVIELEAYLISTALVSPKLTPADVKTWQSLAGPGELDPVMRTIRRLSGLSNDIAKEHYKSD